jgi:enoyl-CoA hydratase/carnithine racemase
MIIGYKKARELPYLGDTIDARAALDLGMVNRVVPLAKLREASLRYAKRLSLISPEALFAAKRAVNRGADAAGFRTAPLRRAQRCRSALRDENGIRHKIPRHRVSRKCPRRRQMARRAVQGVALFGRR